MSKEEKMIQAAANVLIEAVIRLVEQDPHQFSTRPCSTCRAVSSIIDKPFGCVRKAMEKKG
jgi:hypothetical protein